MLVLVMGLAVSPALASVDAVSMLETKAPRTPGCPDTLEICLIIWGSQNMWGSRDMWVMQYEGWIEVSGFCHLYCPLCIVCVRN